MSPHCNYFVHNQGMTITMQITMSITITITMSKTRMGMVILSFTIKDMRDDVEHLESLGKAQTAVVRSSK